MGWKLSYIYVYINMRFRVLQMICFILHEFEEVKLTQTRLVGWYHQHIGGTCPACSNRIMTNRSAPTKCIKINALSLPTSSQRTLHVYTCLIHISPRNLPPSLYTPVVSSTPWSYSSPSERKAACATKSTTTIVLLRFARGILLCCWGYVVGWRRSRFLSVSGERLVLR